MKGCARPLAIAAFGMMTLGMGSIAFAQGPVERLEPLHDRVELRQDKEELKKDRRVFVDLTRLLDRFDAARARRDIGALDAIDRDLRRIVRAGLFEKRADANEARAEVAGSRAEVLRSEREVRRNALLGAPPPAQINDVRDLRDDRRDARDDAGDAARRAGISARWNEIARDLEGLYFQQRPRALRRKRALLVELIDLARVEHRENKSELREDLQEMQEDRHELMERVP